MSDPSFWSIAAVALSLIVTMIGSLLAVLSYGHHRRQALSYWERLKGLPNKVEREFLVRENEKLREEYESLKDNVFDAQQTIDAAAHQRQWMDNTKEEIARLEQDKAEVLRIQNELETAQSQLAALNEQKAQLDGEVAQRKAKLEEYENEANNHRRLIVDLELEIQRLQQVKAQMAVVESELAEKQLVLEKLLAEIDQASRKHLEDVERFEKQLKEIRDRSDEFRVAVERLGKEKRELEAEVSELKKEREKLRNEVERLTGIESATKEKVKIIQDAAGQVAAMNGSEPLPPEENEIWQPVIAVATASERETRDELECLNDLNRRLLSLGLKFDRRVLYAFHTSLKTTDSSPLVTLAGVSGTGKSELPRRYAEATGMNFLNVAIQPRWDSPQDLFGFYDYLERRFRPTDLTRALIQMDTFGPEEGRGWNPPAEYQKQRLPNQLLLVLLDEMNLARIEYYFSEFLSRLETRRGVVRTYPHRKLAEISLDVGGRRSGQPPMQLFVDKNVLFVGTMNEDETTQALSDKVIDRANILRFGSPNSVSPNQNPNLQNQMYHDTPRLSKKTWEGWSKSKKDLEPSLVNNHMEWIEKIRKKLNRINRPFAHRVTNGILEYAANYPDVQDRTDFIVGDQIEQKILPKLIGLNPQEPRVRDALSEIKAVLGTVKDDLLISQIDSCCGDDYFQWTGLDRS